MDAKTVAHDRAEFDRLPFLQPAENLGSGSGNALHEELKSTTSRREGRRRSDGQKRWLFDIRNTELQILTWSRVGRYQIGGVRNVDGNVEERFRGGFDERERCRRPDDGVLTKGGGGDDGGDAFLGRESKMGS